MLAKSKKSAVVMALVSVFSLQTTVVILSAISHLLGGEIDASFWIFGDESGAYLFLNILFVFLGIAAFAAYIYKRFGQDHFGVGGMIRWMIYGSLYTLLHQLYKWLSPPLLRGFEIRWLFVWGILYLSHWFAFKFTFAGMVKPKSETPDVPN